MKKLNLIVSVVAVSGLVACGGGSGGSGSSTSSAASSTPSAATAFSYKQAVVNNYQNGITVPFNATLPGTGCSGTGTFMQSPLTTLTTFNTLSSQGVSALSGGITITIDWTNCSTSQTTIASTDYIDSSTLIPLGFSASGVYGVYSVPPVIPASVAVGDSGSLGTVQLYTGSSEITPIGTETILYAVTDGTDSSNVTVTVTSNSYDATNTLVATVTEIDQLSSAGTLTPTSITMVNLLTGTTITLN